MAGSKYTDTTSIIQVIGGILKKPSLLNDEGKYFFSEEDFTNEFHKIIFGSIYNLYKMGATFVTTKAIEDYLENREQSLALYKKNNGAEWLSKIIDNTELANFDYYYQRMKKMSLLRGYDNFGLDLKWLYDPDNILDLKKKREQENHLDNLSLVEIADIIDDELLKIRSEYVDNSTEESTAIGDHVFEILQELKETPDVGLPLYGDYINTVTRGCRLKKFYLRSAATGVGKALTNSTKLPTPIGWREVKDIIVGDYLFGKDGQPTQVLAVYPQSEKKQVYQVEFVDGRTIECCGEHLWTYYYSGHKERLERTESTQDILDRIRKSNNSSFQSNDGGYRIKVPTNLPVHYPKQNLPIDPYILGLFLGDGSFRFSLTNKALSFSTKDIELIEKIETLTGWTSKKNSVNNFNYTFNDKDNDVRGANNNVWVEEFLKSIPQLCNKKSEKKFIPEEYLTADEAQRWSLLQGLMDTDGSIEKDKGRISYTTVSKQLRDNVLELGRSLGFIVNYSIDKRKDKYTTGECYSIKIQCKENLKDKFFRLSRKKNIAIEYQQNNKRKECKDYIAIKDIKILDKYEDMTCFTVDAEDSLFLCGDYIVTHNTRTMMADACNLACDSLWNELKQEWEPNGQSQPTLFISTELELKELVTLAVAFISGVDEAHILHNSLAFDESDRIQEAAVILQRSPLYLEIIPDFSLRDIENTIKKNIRAKKCQYVFFDYIHTSMKILEEITQRSGGVKLREDNILFLLSVKLKDLCNEFSVFIMSGTQLNGDWKTDEVPDQNLLRGAKSIADKIDAGFIMLDVTTKDQEMVENIVKNAGCKMPNVKMSVYKNRQGSYNRCYLWMDANKSNCRFNTLFLTNYKGELIQIAEQLNLKKMPVKEGE